MLIICLLRQRSHQCTDINLFNLHESGGRYYSCFHQHYCFCKYIIFMLYKVNTNYKQLETKWQLGKVMDVLISLVAVIISLYMCIKSCCTPSIYTIFIGQLCLSKAGKKPRKSIGFGLRLPGV